MIARGAALTAALAGSLALGCKRDRTDSLPPSRSSASSITLPQNPVELASLLGVVPESLRVAAEERYHRQAYDSARAILLVEAHRAVAARDDTAEARARMWLGLAAWRNGDYSTARKEGQTSLALKRKLGLDAELSRSFNALGLLSWNEGKHREALTEFDSAVATARRNNDAPGLARATANIPLVLVELGQYDAASRGFMAAREAARAIDDTRVEGNALANLGMLLIRLGRAPEALPLLAEARRCYAKDEYAPGEANALGQRATALAALGNLEGAIATADSGLIIARTAGLAQEVAATNEVIADLYAQAGSLRLALRRLQQADSIDAAVGLTMEQGINSRRISAILLELGDTAAAVSKARAALTVHRNADDLAELVYDRIALSQALSSSDVNAAAAQLDAALVEAAKTKNISARRAASIAAVRLSLSRSKPRDAQRQLSFLGPSKQSDDWQMAETRAAVALALGQLREARLYGEQAVTALERERATLGGGPLRTGYLTGRVGPYSKLVSIDMALGDTAAAFRVAASIPGRSIAERLGNLGVAAVPEVASGERLLWEAAALEKDLEGASSEEQKQSLQKHLVRVRSDYEDLVARQGFSSRSRLLAVGSIDLDSIRADLAPDDALLTFLAGPDRLDVFVVRRNRFFHQSVPIGDQQLAVRVRVLRELVSSSQPGGAPSALTQFHDLLLSAVVKSGILQGTTRLLIVPHGSLGAVPFAALFDVSTGHYLVEKHIIVMLPSVAVVSTTRGREPSSYRGVSVFAPESNSLGGTIREAKAIARLFPRAVLRLGKQSTERAIRASLLSDGIVHIASHGFHNQQNPLFSEVVVGKPDRKDLDGDGRLQVYEILGMRISESLVFLSGCETGVIADGSDPIARGIDEGSLAQAFLVAGARTVVSTLWRVGDEAAARLAERYYTSLKSGVGPEASLAAAQREMIGRRKGFEWAAYTVTSASPRKFGEVFRETGTESLHKSKPE